VRPPPCVPAPTMPRTRDATIVAARVIYHYLDRFMRDLWRVAQDSSRESTRWQRFCIALPLFTIIIVSGLGGPKGY